MCPFFSCCTASSCRSATATFLDMTRSFFEFCVYLPLPPYPLCQTHQFPSALHERLLNPRILLMLNFVQRIHCSYACAFHFSLPFSFSHRDPVYCTLSFNCVQVQALPTEQAAPALTDSFSRGYDPYTYACKARPLTPVGRTSLSLIVIVIVPSVKHEHQVVAAGCPLSFWRTESHPIVVHIARRHVRRAPR